MKPEIEHTAFGSISVNGIHYDHDIIIRKNGTVEKRKKKLSKAVYGSSHTVSRDEIAFVHEEGIEGIIIGSGQYGVLKLSEEASEYLHENGCRFIIQPTPDALKVWNNTEGQFNGLFHITC